LKLPGRQRSQAFLLGFAILLLRSKPPVQENKIRVVSIGSWTELKGGIPSLKSSVQEIITSGVDLMMRTAMKLLGREDGRSTPALLEAVPDKSNGEGENDDC
jgi:hypothetical protein